MPSLRNRRNVAYYDYTGQIVRHLDANEANRMLAAGDHEAFCISCRAVKRGDAAMRLCPSTMSKHWMALRQLAPEVKDDSKLKGRDESPCSLSDKDMQKNVGITEGFPGAPADMAQVGATRARVANWSWASAHNSRTVTVVSALGMEQSC